MKLRDNLKLLQPQDREFKWGSLDFGSGRFVGERLQCGEMFVVNRESLRSIITPRDFRPQRLRVVILVRDVVLQSIRINGEEQLAMAPIPAFFFTDPYISLALPAAKKGTVVSILLRNEGPEPRTLACWFEGDYVS